MPCPTPLPKSLPGLEELRASGLLCAAFTCAQPGGYQGRGDSSPAWIPLEGGMGGSAAAAAPKPGLRRIPAGTHPAGPAPLRSPPQKAALAAQPPRFVKKERFFIKIKNPGIPPAATPWREPPLAQLTALPSQGFPRLSSPQAILEKCARPLWAPRPAPQTRSPRCPGPGGH